MRRMILQSVLLYAIAASAMGGPILNDNLEKREPFRRIDAVEPPDRRLTPNDFRCLIIGDSQTTTPSSKRIRVQAHRWDAPQVGEQIVGGFSSSGVLVANSTAGIPNLAYNNVSAEEGWINDGPSDFFATGAAQWWCASDIEFPLRRIGQYRLRFGKGNSEAPWDESWGIGTDLVARVAVRTSPACVDAIETRAERGGVVDADSRRIHVLDKSWGVQILEQPIPADFNPKGDDVGVGLYFAQNVLEQTGQVLQVLGVSIERVDPLGNRMPGMFLGYQGQSGWNMQDHLSRVSRISRMALVELIDPDYVMIMLGHNREPGGIKAQLPTLLDLVSEWEVVFAATGRARPTFVFVTPWTIMTQRASTYIRNIEENMRTVAGLRSQDVFVSFLEMFDYWRPDIVDPERYQLDFGNVHPDNVPSADHLSEDLYRLLFDPE